MNNVITLNRPATLAALLAAAPAEAGHTQALRRLRTRLWLPVAVVGSLVALWCAWAPLSGAVVGSGQVQSELGRKVVQHQEGGIVRELLVRPGQVVRRGDALLVVGDVRSDAALDLLRKQMEAERIRSERARAELAMAAGFGVPASVDKTDSTLQRERQLFDARRQTLDAQLSALNTQMRDAHARIAALGGQLEAAERSTALAGDELRINTELVDSGFMQKTRLITLERGVADLRARSASTRGEIAEARMQLSALANTMAQVRGSYQQRAADELKDAGTRLRELDDRLRPTQDQALRQTVRAPVDGTVMGLRVSAPGTAVGPRETLLEIAPSQENLVVDLRIDPHDIDHVQQGGAAEVRLAAFNSRSTPLLKATVTTVSPDAVTDPATRQPWYGAQVEVPAEELARHPELRLQAGMPAEVFITTEPRSLLAYLLEPLGLFARRALREP
jgi:HlyD family type I secretion membrane fusion protein